MTTLKSNSRRNRNEVLEDMKFEFICFEFACHRHYRIVGSRWLHYTWTNARLITRVIYPRPKFVAIERILLENRHDINMYRFPLVYCVRMKLDAGIFFVEFVASWNARSTLSLAILLPLIAMFKPLDFATNVSDTPRIFDDLPTNSRFNFLW